MVLFHNETTLISLLLFLCATGYEAKLEVGQIASKAADHQVEKRQNGYGNGMWGNNGNFPPMGNWNGPNSNGYGGPQPPAPDDSIKGSIGTKEEEKKSEENGQQGGQWWPNGGQPNGGYNNNGPNPGGYNGNVPNGYNNGPNSFGGPSESNRNVDDGIKGSVGAAVEPTKSPNPPNGWGYGNRPGYGNGYGNPNNNNGFNRMAGYGQNFGRPILPRGERFLRERRY